jgi:hypothetical protein
MFPDTLHKKAKRRALASAALRAGLLAGSMASAQSVSNLSLLDRSHDNDDVDAQLYFQAEIANGGTVAAPLSPIWGSGLSISVSKTQHVPTSDDVVELRVERH